MSRRDDRDQDDQDDQDSRNDRSPEEDSGPLGLWASRLVLRRLCA
ncbi:hypothetical protein [Streptomyces sp. NPDC057554]